MISSNRAGFTLSVGLGVVLASCGSGTGTGGNEATAPENTVPVPGNDDLRAVVESRGIGPIPAVTSVSEELFDLGKALFFDKLLSGNHNVSCATCHWPELGSADARTLPRGGGGVGLGKQRFGGAIIPRNSPPALNAHMLNEVFWDGRVTRNRRGLVTPAGAALTVEMQEIFDPRWELLAAQAMFPPTSRQEMRGAIGQNELGDLGDTELSSIWDGLRDRIVGFVEYQQLFLAAYPELTAISQIEFAHAANAIAAFEVGAFARSDSPFERFVGGDNQALSEIQVAGGLEFFGRAGCARCHSGELFTDQRFHNIGLPQLGPGQGDGASGAEDYGRERVTGNRGDRYEFRTPTLLNIELTAPYGHAGQYATLESMVGHYRNAEQALLSYNILTNVSDVDLLPTLVDNQAQILTTLDRGLRDNRNFRFDADAIVAFLRALTADSANDMRELVPERVPSGLPLR